MKKGLLNILKRLKSIVSVSNQKILIVTILLVLSMIITFIQPMTVSNITDKGLLQKNMQYTILYSIVFFITLLLIQLLEILKTKIYTQINRTFIYDLRNLAYNKLYNLPITYYQKHSSVEVINVIETDILNISLLTSRITIYSIVSILQIVGGIIGLSILNLKLALIITLCIPLKFCISALFSKRKKIIIENIINSNKKLNSWLGDFVEGIKEIKLWNLYQSSQNQLNSIQNEYLSIEVKDEMMDQYQNSCEIILDAIITCSIYILGGYLVFNDNLTIGELFAFIAYSDYVLSPISLFSNFQYYLARIIPSAERFFSFIDMDEEKNFVNNIKYSSEYSTNSEYKIELSNINFAYANNKYIINGLNLYIKENEKIGIIGENGSGKSTLVDILLGLNYPNEGKIKFNGISIENLSREYIRNNISVVTQNFHLFNTSIKDNIDLTGKASNIEIKEACKKSGADSIINKFKNGLEEIVGVSGMELSGGERQKIAISRALLKDTDILVFDEATSALDPKSDFNFNKIILEEFKEKTIIIISHRYESLKGLDKLYNLKDGKLHLISCKENISEKAAT